jgi:HAD superfamily hydrolase (TIGR01509 family)
MFSEIKGFIFDLDDTLVETEKLNVKLITHYFYDTWKISLDNEDKDIVFGHSWQDIYTFIINKYSLPISIYDAKGAVLKRKNVYLKQNKLTLAKGADLVVKMPVKKVIVSGSAKDEIKMILENINMSEHFDASFSSDDYGKGKPEPDGYLMALEYLNLSPDKVLVFEDAISGIDGAKKAGMTTVFIKEFAKDDCSHIADFSFQDFEVFYKQFMKSFKA